MPVTDYIEATATIVRETLDTLKPVDGFRDVLFFPGTSYRDLFEWIPGLHLPAAVVIYTGSDYDNQPRRTIDLTVLVACSMPRRDDEALNGIAVQVDRVVAALDEHILNQAKWEAEGDEPVDLDGVAPQVACALVRFRVEDY